MDVSQNEPAVAERKMIKTSYSVNGNSAGLIFSLTRLCLAAKSPNQKSMGNGSMRQG